MKVLQIEEREVYVMEQLSKIKVGFVGLGQCGSNIAEIAELYGYRTAVCNTSPEDLDAIQLIKNKVLLGSNGGAGKDRKMAKNDAKLNYDKVVDLVKHKFEGIDMIYFVFSTGGGTGSGMSPMMIDVVRQLVPDKKFGCIAVLPTKTESLVAQINTVNCLREIVKLEIPSFIADNDKLYAKGKPKSRKELFDRMNNYIIDSFNLILNTQRTPSKYGNLDQQDIIRLLSTPGATVITTSNISAAERKEEGYSFGKKIMSSWDHSYFAPLEYDHKITRMGYIYEINEATTKLVDYDVIKQEIGNPLEIFEGYYTPEADGTEVVISILTGLSYPIRRIEEIKQLVLQGKTIAEDEQDYDAVFDGFDTSWFDQARDKKTMKTLQDEEDDLEEYDEFEEVSDAADPTAPVTVRKKKPTPKKAFDIADIFAKYE